MTWATITTPEKTSTHYYMGTTSLCLNSSLADDSHIQLVKHATDSNKYCKNCKTVLKSNKVHKVISRQQRAINLHRNHSMKKFQKSLEDMLCTWLEYHSKSRTIPIDEFKEFLSDEYRYVSSGAILVSLLAQNKVSITQGNIIPSPMEVSHV